jgi:phage/plasmid-associated DNA primase
VAALDGKAANICADLPSQDLSSTSIFKEIVGGDALVAERKFHPQYDLTLFCKLIFSANHYPRSKDASHGFFRRFLMIRCDQVFEAEKHGGWHALMAELTSAGELSGLLNKVLLAFDRLKASKAFSLSDTTRDAQKEFRDQTDPVAQWLDAHTVTNATSYVSRKDLLIAYTGYALKLGVPAPSQKAFCESVRLYRPMVKDGQRMVGGRREYCFLGLGLREGREMPPDPYHSHHSHHFSQISSDESVEVKDREIEGNGMNGVNRENELPDHQLSHSSTVEPLPTSPASDAPYPVGSQVQYEMGLGHPETAVIQAHTTNPLYPGQISYLLDNGRMVPHSHVLHEEPKDRLSPTGKFHGADVANTPGESRLNEGPPDMLSE